MKEEKRSLPLIEHHVPKLQVSVHNVFLENNRHMVCTVKVRARVGPACKRWALQVLGKTCLFRLGP